MQKQRTTLKVAALLNNEGQLGWLPTNPRQWTKSDIDLTAQSLTNDPDFLEDRPLLVVPGPGKSFIVFAGNLRLTAARQLKIKEVPGIIYTPENETDQLTIKRRSVLDNGAFGAWDYDALANEWDDLPLGDWGVPAWNPEAEMDDLDDSDKEYSRKIEAPIYEPQRKGVALTELTNTGKYDELVSEIERADIPKPVKEFLRVAATRHIVFDYEKIADYYADAPAEIQNLMEQSALVIIDFGKAIEGGFIKMSEELRREYMNGVQ